MTEEEIQQLEEQKKALNEQILEIVSTFNDDDKNTIHAGIVKRLIAYHCEEDNKIFRKTVRKLNKLYNCQKEKEKIERKIMRGKKKNGETLQGK